MAYVPPWRPAATPAPLPKRTARPLSDPLPQETPATDPLNLPAVSTDPADLPLIRERIRDAAEAKRDLDQARDDVLLFILRGHPVTDLSGYPPHGSGFAARATDPIPMADTVAPYPGSMFAIASRASWYPVRSMPWFSRITTRPPASEKTWPSVLYGVLRGSSGVRIPTTRARNGMVPRTAASCGVGRPRPTPWHRCHRVPPAG